MLLSCNSGNDNFYPTNCTEVYVYGLKVTVNDVMSNAIITDGLTVTSKGGNYEEQLMRLENYDFFVGVGEREGTYLIEITSNDYQMFTSANIIVSKTEDDCHVITKELEFALQPN